MLPNEMTSVIDWTTSSRGDLAIAVTHLNFLRHQVILGQNPVLRWPNVSMATSEPPLVRVWTAAHPNQVAESCSPR
jgi:hypothetical protein